MVGGGFFCEELLAAEQQESCLEGQVVVVVAGDRGRRRLGTQRGVLVLRRGAGSSLLATAVATATSTTRSSLNLPGFQVGEVQHLAVFVEAAAAQVEGHFH